MKTYDHADYESTSSRAHPWTDAVANSSHRYYDFKKAPHLVRSVIEDLTPWAYWPAIETFYRLLEWVNGPASIFESNDCAFSGPARNESAEVPSSLEVTGRVMILWRRLSSNLSHASFEWLKERTHHYLNRRDTDFRLGAIGITTFQSRYVTLPVAPENQHGFQLMLSFWSWGDDENEVWANLHRTLQNLWEALREVEREVRETRAIESLVLDPSQCSKP